MIIIETSLGAVLLPVPFELIVGSVLLGVWVWVLNLVRRGEI